MVQCRIKEKMAKAKKKSISKCMDSNTRLKLLSRKPAGLACHHSDWQYQPTQGS
jgi:hypothetical protein